MNKLVVVSLIVVLIMTGCSSSPQVPVSPTVDVDAMVRAQAATSLAHYTETAAAVTPTLTITLTPPPPPTLTATSAPIPKPVDAVAGSNVTVRDEPRKGGKNVGGIFFNQGMKIIARNDVASWYYIEWSKSPTGTAWVLATAVDMKDNDPTHLPIAILDSAKKVTILPPILWSISGTPLPINAPGAGAQTALITQFAKVRVGPGLGYSTMGTIDVGSTVVITGRTDKNAWLQIEYPSGPGGRGWLAGELVEMKGAFAGLPFYNLLATPIGDPDLAATPNPNATPEASATLEPTPAGPTGEVTASELNVHSGPASEFKSVGMLKLGETVVITGLTINRLWYRIVYSAAPDGYGYISPKYIKITGGDMTKLKYLNDQGTSLP